MKQSIVGRAYENPVDLGNPDLWYAAHPEGGQGMAPTNLSDLGITGVYHQKNDPYGWNLVYTTDKGEEVPFIGPQGSYVGGRSANQADITDLANQYASNGAANPTNSAYIEEQRTPIYLGGVQGYLNPKNYQPKNYIGTAEEDALGGLAPLATFASLAVPGAGPWIGALNAVASGNPLMALPGIIGAVAPDVMGGITSGISDATGIPTSIIPSVVRGGLQAIQGGDIGDIVLNESLGVTASQVGIPPQVARIALKVARGGDPTPNDMIALTQAGVKVANGKIQTSNGQVIPVQG